MVTGQLLARPAPATGCVRRAHRAVPARTAGALLPDARLGRRRRGHAAGDADGRLARASTFEGRASLRTWLYRIATNRCLNALRDGAGGPRASAEPPADAADAHPHAASRSGLSPTRTRCSTACPTPRPGRRPGTRPGSRSSLAFVAALQHLPPRQRAVLVLRDVLGFRAAEVGGACSTPREAPVNSALKRARATIAASCRRAAATRPRCQAPPRERELAARSPTRSSAATSTASSPCSPTTPGSRMPPAPLEYQGPR